MDNPPFPSRTTTADIELGARLQPKFDAEGLIPCITCDHVTNEVLMFAFMNAEALAQTPQQGCVRHGAQDLVAAFCNGLLWGSFC